MTVRAATAVAVALCLAGTACGPGGADRDGRIDVVAAFAPLAEVATRVGGEDVVVHDLTPAGAEPHDLEPTTEQVEDVEDADLVVVLGHGFQPGVEDLAARRGDAALRVLDALADDGADARPDDPHVWLDPILMRALVDEVAGALARVDPEHAGAYHRRAASYGAEVARVGHEYERRLADCERDLLVTAHDAFGWLAARFGLRHRALTGLAPDVEPDPARLAELADLAEREGVTTVFTEALLPADLAETLAREADGLRTAVLDPLEGTARGADDSGTDWVRAMRANLGAIADALGCR
jgi:zinc transport system substrate-binding protein